MKLSLNLWTHCSCIFYFMYTQVWSFIISKRINHCHHVSSVIFPGLMWWQSTLIHQVLSRLVSMKLWMCVSHLCVLCSLYIFPSISPSFYSKLVSPWINILNHRNGQQLWSIDLFFKNLGWYGVGSNLMLTTSFETQKILEWHLKQVA